MGVSRVVKWHNCRKSEKETFCGNEYITKDFSLYPGQYKHNVYIKDSAILGNIGISLTVWIYFIHLYSQ